MPVLQHSVRSAPRPWATRRAVDSSADLNLDQVFAEVTAGRDEYDLTPFFRTPLHTPGGGIPARGPARPGRPGVRRRWSSFANRHARSTGASPGPGAKLRHRYQKERLVPQRRPRLLPAVVARIAAVLAVAGPRLPRLSPRSGTPHRLRRLRRVHRLAVTPPTIEEALDGLGTASTSRETGSRSLRYEGEADFSADVAADVREVRRESVKDYRARFRSWPEMDHVEEYIAGPGRQAVPGRVRRRSTTSARGTTDSKTIPSPPSTGRFSSTSPTWTSSRR